MEKAKKSTTLTRADANKSVWIREDRHAALDHLSIDMGVKLIEATDAVLAAGLKVVRKRLSSPASTN